MFEKNLKYYRLKKGMTKRALAEACSVTPMAISHYELGDRKPSMDIVQSIARALDIKVADLLKRRNTSLVFQHGDFRKSTSFGVSEQEYVRNAVEEYCGRLFDVLECLGGDVLPDCPKSSCIPLSENVDDDALALREHLHLNPIGPVRDLIETLENLGFVVVVFDVDNEAFSGLSGYVSGRPYIACNAQMSSERIRSTIVHELAHLMFDWSEECSGKKQEDRATAISGAFLLPEKDIRRELGISRKAITKDMELVAQEYGVSMMFLAKRAHLAGVVGDQSYKAFCVNASKAGWRKHEPSRIEVERPMLLRQLVFRAVSEDDCSIQRGAELLGLSFDEVAAYCAVYEA